MYELYAIAIVIILIILYFNSPPRVNILVSEREWNVIDYENKREAAEKLSRLHTRMMKFLRALKERYHIDETQEEIDSEGAEHTAIVAREDTYTIVGTLLDNYNPDHFYENDPRSSSDTSYTVNKGTSMYICLRDRANPNVLIDDDIIFFVLLHECAHIGNYNGWGHDDRFWTVFKFILNEAVTAGVYTPVDYAKHPVDYCGLRVYYNPLLDPSLPLLL